MSVCVFFRGFRGLVASLACLPLLLLPAALSAETPRIVQLAVGNAFSCALDSNEQVWCWGGINVDADSDEDDWDFEPHLTPVRFERLGTVRVLAAHHDAGHICMINEFQRVFCWGWNNVGQLGDGTTTNRYTPVRVEGLGPAQALVVGSNHSCAIDGRDRIFCWGSNSHGQLGDGTTETRLTPSRVRVLRTGSALAAGGAHTCALDLDGRAHCWGWNGRGQIGDGSTETRLTPERVRNLARSSMLSLGTSHSCALDLSGHANCWGWNQFGELGDGTTEQRLTPARVQNLWRNTSLAASSGHSCAVTRHGRVRCWGWNWNGQLGDGTRADRLAPVLVPNLDSVEELSLGLAHTCALTEEGRVFCWGWNQFGQLGDGTTEDRLTPVEVAFPTNEPPLFPIAGFDENPIERINHCYGAHNRNHFEERYNYIRGQYHTGVDLRTRDLNTPIVRAPVDGEIVYYRRRSNSDPNPDWNQTFAVLRGDDGHDYILAHMNCNRTDDDGVPYCDESRAMITDTEAYPPEAWRRVERGTVLGEVPNFQMQSPHLHLGVVTRPIVDERGVLISEFHCAFWARIPFAGQTGCADNNRTRPQARRHALNLGFIDPLSLYAEHTTCECLYSEPYCPTW
ncbi:MAG: hypothetical protein JJT95_12085 [Pararhodobacter sp.]|nr:hypothetical protein [Pararhodobacter sp.]